MNDGRCIYCAGASAATTLDHMPPVAMFKQRQRPLGLEFPSCPACNTGARQSDRVAAMLCRLSMDEPDEEEAAEMEALLAAINRDIPALLHELQAPRAQERRLLARLGRDYGGGLFVGGPIASAHLEAFAARRGFAFHFHATGNSIPAEGGVTVRYYTNVDLLDDLVPRGIFEHLPTPSTLRAGAKEVGEQFKYGVTATADGTMSMSYASFGQGFDVLTFGSTDRSRIELPHARVFVPGALDARPAYSAALGFRVRVPYKAGPRW